MKNSIVSRGIAVLVILAFLLSILATPSVSYADSSVVFLSKKDAGSYFAQQLDKHRSKIVVNYETTSSDGSGLAKDIVMESFRDGANNKTLQGDYLHYAIYNGYKLTYIRYKVNGKYHYEFTYNVTYKATAAQEKAFETKLAATMKALNLNGKSQYDKVKKIYDYITDNVTYDRKHGSTYYQKYTAYAALCNKTAVCQGYANLFYRMCKDAGIPVRIVTGTSRNQGHAWNVVSIDGKFYNVDATWDAGKSNYAYFLKSNKNFNDHKRNTTYSSEAFNNQCPMSSDNYSSIVKSKTTIKVKKASSTAAKVTWKKISKASGYIVYRSTNGGKYKKVATLSSSKVSYTNKKLKSKKTYTYKVKAYQKSGSSTVYSKLSSGSKVKL